jgi:putative transposase
LAVLAYCLMTNHVHLVVVPDRADSLALALGRAHWLYTQAVNRRHGRTGHLWQNRFFSCAAHGPHLWQAARYVELNPVRAGLCTAAAAYEWSSAAMHCGTGPAALPADDGLVALPDVDLWGRLSAGRLGLDPAGWRQLLGQEQDDAEVKAIRRATHTGRPLAIDSFLGRLEAKLGRRLRPLPVGRPRKRKQK